MPACYDYHKELCKPKGEYIIVLRGKKKLGVIQRGDMLYSFTRTLCEGLFPVTPLFQHHSLKKVKD